MLEPYVLTHTRAETFFGKVLQRVKRPLAVSYFVEKDQIPG